MTQTIFQVGARHADGKTSLWHVPADSQESARSEVMTEILKTKPFKHPLVVLACIPGGKS